MSEVRWLILPMEMRHVKEASDVHIAAFPGYFLSFLGRGFLRELYRAFACDDTSIALVAEDASFGKILGVAVGTLNPKRFFRRLASRRWWAFGLSSLSTLARNPKVAERIVRAVFYRGDAPRDKMRALLSSIAVIPGQQKTGLGSILLKKWEKMAREKGALGCYLTTDALNNDAVIRFYDRNGWKVESTFVKPESRKMLRYILDWE